MRCRPPAASVELEARLHHIQVEITRRRRPFVTQDQPRHLIQLHRQLPRDIRIDPGARVRFVVAARARESDEQPRLRIRAGLPALKVVEAPESTLNRGAMVTECWDRPSLPRMARSCASSLLETRSLRFPSTGHIDRPSAGWRHPLGLPNRAAGGYGAEWPTRAVASLRGRCRDRTYRRAWRRSRVSHIRSGRQRGRSTDAGLTSRAYRRPRGRR